MPTSSPPEAPEAPEPPEPRRRSWRRNLALAVLVVGAVIGSQFVHLGNADVTLKIALRNVEPALVRTIDLRLEQGGDLQRNVRLHFDPAHPATPEIWHPTHLPRGACSVHATVELEGKSPRQSQHNIEIKGGGDVVVVEL